MEKLTLNVEGMTCGGCATSIQNALNNRDGVTSAEADVAAGTVSVEFDSAVIQQAALEQATFVADALHECRHSSSPASIGDPPLMISIYGTSKLAFMVQTIANRSAAFGRYAAISKPDDMIREKVETMNAIEQGRLALDDRLTGAKEHLIPFLAARDALIESGREALELFEKEGKEYSDFIVSNMGHHPPTADLGAKLFSAEDWEYMAGITDEDVERETALFDRVQETLPGDVKGPDS